MQKAAKVPLREAAYVLAAERLHGDDTTVLILAKGKTVTGRIWTYVRDDRPFGGQLALTGMEITLLDNLVSDTSRNPAGTKTLAHYLTKIARLGGYLARAGDPPPGNMVMWNGFSRLIDIELGATMGAGFVGN